MASLLCVNYSTSLAFRRVFFPPLEDFHNMPVVLPLGHLSRRHSPRQPRADIGATPQQQLTRLRVPTLGRIQQGRKLTPNFSGHHVPVCLQSVAE